MLDRLTEADFAAYLNQKFCFYPDDGDEFLEAELIRVNVLGEPYQPQSRIPFSITFWLPKGTDLPQQIYRLKHPSLGEMAIFFVPLGPAKDGMLYEAIFT